MVRMSGRVLSCCVALFLTLTSVAAVKKLHSINDLRKINFGQSVPRHSLLLLHWFANILNIDNVIYLRFNPFNRDYGSHRYYDNERLLDPLPPGHLYYTVGNLNEYSAQLLPDYVTDPPADYAGRNSDRIIFRVREQSTVSPTIDRVYLTQHSAYYRSYDPAYTYEITTSLLREIREFSVEENHWSLRDLRDRFGRNVDDFQLEDIRNTCGQLAFLGLFLHIVLQAKYSSNKFNYRPQQVARRNPQPDVAVNIPENTQDHRDADTSDICTCIGNLLSFLFAVLVVIIIILFFSGRLK